MIHAAALVWLIGSGLLLAGCTELSDAPGAGPASPATSATPSKSPPQIAPVPRPTTWSGVRVASDRVVVEANGEAVWVERTPEGGTGDRYTDVDYGAPVLWSTCCEPVLGTTRAREGFNEYGARVDRVGDTMVRVGADGTVFVRDAGVEQVVGFSGVLDAAVVGDRVVGLRDFEQVPDPEVDKQINGLTLVHISKAANVTEVVSLPKTACAVVRYGDDAVAVLEPDGGGPVGPLYCRGTRLTVLDAATGEQRDKVTFDEQIVHVSADDSGQWLILTRQSGAVDWIGIDGTTGRLAESGYVRADW